MPKTKKPALLRSSLALAYFAASGLFPHAAEARLWEERREARARLEAAWTPPLPAPLSEGLPAGLSGSPAGKGREGHPVLRRLAALSGAGSLQSFRLSPDPGAPFVVHIQDVHGVEEAQRNIARVIEGLAAGAPLPVGLEAAVGRFDLSAYLAYGDPALLRGVMGHFLSGGHIGGAEYAALTSGAPVRLFGVEAPRAWAANVRAVEAGAAVAARAEAALAGLEARRARLLRRAASPALDAFERLVAGHAAGTVPLGDYVRDLSALAGAPGRFPQADLFRRAAALESSLDFGAVEKERLRLARALAERLPPAALEALARRGLSYRERPEEGAAYHAYLKELCRAHGVRLAEFGPLASYIDYLSLTDRIERGALLAEFSGLERAAAEALPGPPSVRRLAAAGLRLRLARRLAAHEMTPEDWAEYEAGRGAVLDLPAELVRLGEPAAEGPGSLAGLLAPFEDFCRLALARNEALVDNLLAQTGSSGPGAVPAAVLVAGGFHTAGLTERLAARGCSYAVVTPRVTRLPEGPSALDVFTRDPLPLEKLFAGEPISLDAWRPLSPVPAPIRRLADGGRAFRFLSLSLLTFIRDGFSGAARGVRERSFRFGEVLLRLQGSRKKADLPRGPPADVEGEAPYGGGPVYFRGAASREGPRPFAVALSMGGLAKTVCQLLRRAYRQTTIDVSAIVKKAWTLKETDEDLMFLAEFTAKAVLPADGPLMAVLRNKAKLGKLKTSLLKANVLGTFNVTSGEELSLSEEIREVFESQNVRDVSVGFHAGEDAPGFDFVEDPDHFLLALFHSKGPDGPQVSLDLRFAQALMVLPKARRRKILETFVRRELGLKGLVEGGAAYDQAYREILKEPGQQELIDWVRLFLVPIWQVRPAFSEGVQRDLYLYAAQALKMVDPETDYQPHQLEAMDGRRPTLEDMAHILWHVIRTVEEVRLTFEQTEKTHPRLALSPERRDDLLRAAALHDLGKLHPKLIHIFLSPKKIEKNAEERKLIAQHEELSSVIAEELGRPVPEASAKILHIGSAIWNKDWGTVLKAYREDPSLVIAALFLSRADIYDGFRDLLRAYHNKDWFPGHYPSLLGDVYQEILEKFDGLLEFPEISEVVSMSLDLFRELHAKEAFVQSLERTYPAHALLAIQKTVREGGEHLSARDRLQVVMEEVARYGLLSLRSPPDAWWPMLVHRGLLHDVPTADVRRVLKDVATEIQGRAERVDPVLRDIFSEAAESGDPSVLLLTREQLYSLFPPSSDYSPREELARQAVEAYLGLSPEEVREKYGPLIRARARMLKLEDQVLHIGGADSVLPVIDAALGAGRILVSDESEEREKAASAKLRDLARDKRFGIFPRIITFNRRRLDLRSLPTNWTGESFHQVVMWNVLKRQEDLQKHGPARLFPVDDLVRKLRPGMRLWLTDDPVLQKLTVTKVLKAFAEHNKVGLKGLPASAGAFTGAEASVAAFQVLAPKGSEPEPRSSWPAWNVFHFLTRRLPGAWPRFFDVFGVPVPETWLAWKLAGLLKGYFEVAPGADLFHALPALIGVWIALTAIAVLVHVPTDWMDKNLTRANWKSWLLLRLRGALALSFPLVFLSPGNDFLGGLFLHVVFNLDRRWTGGMAWSIIPRGMSLKDALLQRVGMGDEAGVRALISLLRERAAPEERERVLAEARALLDGWSPVRDVLDGALRPVRALLGRRQRFPKLFASAMETDPEGQLARALLRDAASALRVDQLAALLLRIAADLRSDDVAVGIVMEALRENVISAVPLPGQARARRRGLGRVAASPEVAREVRAEAAQALGLLSGGRRGKPPPSLREARRSFSLGAAGRAIVEGVLREIDGPARGLTARPGAGLKVENPPLRGPADHLVVGRYRDPVLLSALEGILESLGSGSGAPSADRLKNLRRDDRRAVEGFLRHIEASASGFAGALAVLKEHLLKKGVYFHLELASASGWRGAVLPLQGSGVKLVKDGRHVVLVRVEEGPESAAGEEGLQREAPEGLAVLSAARARSDVERLLLPAFAGRPWRGAVPTEVALAAARLCGPYFRGREAEGEALDAPGRSFKAPRRGGRLVHEVAEELLRSREAQAAASAFLAEESPHRAYRVFSTGEVYSLAPAPDLLFLYDMLLEEAPASSEQRRAAGRIFRELAPLLGVRGETDKAAAEGVILRLAKEPDPDAFLRKAAFPTVLAPEDLRPKAAARSRLRLVRGEETKRMASFLPFLVLARVAEWMVAAGVPPAFAMAATMALPFLGFWGMVWTVEKVEQRSKRGKYQKFRAKKDKKWKSYGGAGAPAQPNGMDRVAPGSGVLADSLLGGPAGSGTIPLGIIQAEWRDARAVLLKMREGKSSARDEALENIGGDPARLAEFHAKEPGGEASEEALLRRHYEEFLLLVGRRIRRLPKEAGRKEKLDVMRALAEEYGLAMGFRLVADAVADWAERALEVGGMLLVELPPGFSKEDPSPLDAKSLAHLQLLAEGAEEGAPALGFILPEGLDGGAAAEALGIRPGKAAWIRKSAAKNVGEEGIYSLQKLAKLAQPGVNFHDKAPMSAILFNPGEWRQESVARKLFSLFDLTDFGFVWDCGKLEEGFKRVRLILLAA